MKKCLLFHDWVRASVPIDNDIAEKYKVPIFEEYRYCKRCEKWQIFKYRKIWADCEKPILKPVIIAHKIPKY